MLWLIECCYSVIRVLWGLLGCCYAFSRVVVRALLSIHKSDCYGIAMQSRVLWVVVKVLLFNHYRVVGGCQGVAMQLLG